MEIIETFQTLVTPNKLTEEWTNQASHLEKTLFRMNLNNVKKGITPEELVSRMDDAGISKTVLISPHLGFKGGRIPMDGILQAAGQFPERFILGAFGVNPHLGMLAVREFEIAVKDQGFKALDLLPHWLDAPPNDRIYYPLYAKCIELNVPVYVQILMATQPFLRNVMRPECIDEIAAFFPELKIIGIHMGWPWIDEYIALAQKHPNFYINTSQNHPDEWSDNALRFLRGNGRKKMIFGCGPLLDMRDYVQAVRKHNLDEDVAKDFLANNIKAVLKIS